MERKVEDRWTIAMVDEVAWDVGWGSEGDDSITEEEAEVGEEVLMRSSRSSRSCSQTRSYPVQEPFDPINPSLDEPPRSHQEAASRRSASRLQRSLSRAPAFTDRQSSRSNSRTRRSRAPSPSLGGLNGDRLDSGTPTGSPYYSPSYESALLVSPASSPERGRRPTKMNSYLSSRSPSPSLVPSTPVDGAPRYHSLLGLAESSRPESIPRRRSRSRELRPLHFTPDDVPIPETEVLVVDWRAANSKANDGSGHVSSRGRSGTPCAEPQHDHSKSRSRQREVPSSRQMSDGETIRRHGDHNRGKRSESTPPTSVYASLPSWAIPENRGRKPLASVVTTGEEKFLTPVTVTTMSGTTSRKILAQVTRSKSVGHGRVEQELYTLRQQLPLGVEPIAR